MEFPPEIIILIIQLSLEPSLSDLKLDHLRLSKRRADLVRFALVGINWIAPAQFILYSTPFFDHRRSDYAPFVRTLEVSERCREYARQAVQFRGHGANSFPKLKRCFPNIEEAWITGGAIDFELLQGDFLCSKS